MSPRMHHVASLKSGAHSRRFAACGKIPIKIESVGKPAIAAFLRKLQVFKSTADVRRAGKMFLRYSQVGDDMLALRPVVQARERPRPLFLQPLLRLNNQSGTYPM